MKILASYICPPRPRYYSVAWVGLAVTVAGTAASIAQKKKEQKAQQAAQSQAIGAAGKKPRVAEYVPVDFEKEQLHTILGNLRNSDDANSLMESTNASIDADAMKRATHFIPGYRESMRLEGAATNDLLNGRLPYEDVLDIAANRNSLTGALGTPGTGSKATLRDLGLSRLDAIKTGSGLMSNMVDIAQRINPVERRFRPQDMFVSPTDRIQQAMQQNQLIQNSTQNKYNIDAGASPAAQAAAGFGLQNAQQQQGVDWASLAATLGPQLAGAMRSSGSGGYDMSTDPMLYRGSSGMYYTKPTGLPSSSVPKLSDRPYSIAA